MVAAQRIRTANLVLGDVQCAQIYECGGEDVEIKRDVLREALIDLIEKCASVGCQGQAPALRTCTNRSRT